MKNSNVDFDSAGEHQRKKKFWGLRIFAALVIAIIIAGVIYFQGVKNSHDKELDKAKANYQAIKEKVTRVENVKKERIDFFKNSLLADLPAKYSFVSANFIRRLSLIDSSGITLSGIDIKPKTQSIHFTITGSVEKGNKIVRESRFFRFKQAIEAFEDVILVTGQKKREEISQEGLDFTIAGEIELL